MRQQLCEALRFDRFEAYRAQTKTQAHGQSINVSGIQKSHVIIPFHHKENTSPINRKCLWYSIFVMIDRLYDSVDRKSGLFNARSYSCSRPIVRITLGVYEISCQAIYGKKTFPLACKRKAWQGTSEKKLRLANMLMWRKWDGTIFGRSAGDVGGWFKAVKLMSEGAIPFHGRG